jgi:hypothetical protein
MGFEPTTQVIELVQTVRALDRESTVMGTVSNFALSVKYGNMAQYNLFEMSSLSRNFRFRKYF